MSCRANLLGSVALALALSGFSGAGLAQSNNVPATVAVPPLSKAELQGLKAAMPQTEPAVASPKGVDEARTASSPDTAPAVTSALAPAPVEKVPVPAAVEPSPSASAPPKAVPAPDAPSAISAPSASVAPTLAPAAVAPAVVSPAVPEPAPKPAAAPAPAPVEAAKPVEAQRATEAAVSADLVTRLGALTADKGRDAQAIADFYAFRSNVPLWIVNGALTPVARDLMERMNHADEDGLDASVFHISGLDTLSPVDADAQASAELAISARVLTYIRQASSGRVMTRDIGHDIVAAPNMPDPVAALASIAIASNPVAVLEGYNPIAPEYLALKRKLAEVRASTAAAVQAAPPMVPSGPTLKVGMTDTRVAVLRTRLGLTATDAATTDVYDEALQKAVRDFQAQRRLKPNGTVGPSTVAALNSILRAPRVNLESEIIANMERWRWMPHDMGVSNVFVNVPEYMVRVTKDGTLVHESKVVVGKPDTPTPLFSDTMAFVVMNPSWNVPQSIIKKEYLPKLAEDPDYLSRHGFVVTYAGSQMQVRQPPGEGNALGHIKFMFPNNFSVYLHDTSSRSLFVKDKRAFSHGCVRVDNPYKFAEIVMGADNGWTEDRVRDMVGGKEQRIDLKDKIPVHIAYFTAYVNDDGELKLLDDIYGYDRKVISALGLQG